MRLTRRLVGAGLMTCGLFIAIGCGGESEPPAPGAGGQGGGGAECASDATCPRPMNPCETAACLDGACTTRPVADGTELWTQAVGDCKTLVCDGAGKTRSVTDEGDAAKSGMDCRIGGCSGTTPTLTEAPQRAPCDDGGGSLCDGMGLCAQCLDDSDCAAGTCAAGTCS